MAQKNGNVYKGEWRNNKKHGKGIFYWPNAKQFEGTWDNDLCTFEGVYTLIDGKQYILNNIEYKDTLMITVFQRIRQL